MVVMLTGVALTSPLVVPRTRSDGPSRRRGLPGRCRCDSGFPDISAGIEHLVMARVQELYETIQGDPSRRTKKKIELLEAAIERADRRKRATTV